MFVDSNRQSVWDQIRQRDFRPFSSWVTEEVIGQAALRAGVALGGGPLCLFVLVWLAIACAMHPSKSFAAVLVFSDNYISRRRQLQFPPRMNSVLMVNLQLQGGSPWVWSRIARFIGCGLC